jgi:opacity protein-like surface antigen
MRSPLPALCTLPVALLVCAVSASAAVPNAGYHGPRWSLGPLIATYAGPSHADLLFRTNDIMPVMQSEPGLRLSDFETGMPAGLRVYWAYRPALGLAATYSFSDYSSAATFTPHGWSSPRELTTDLYELDFTLHYGMDFVRNQKLLPYAGFGIGFAMADSRLSIELINTPGIHEDSDDPSSPLLPDRQFEIDARDTTMTYIGLAGLIYHFGSRLALNAEIQGVMGDIRQTFEYAGSLQHIQPGTLNADDWKLNDILGGSYPMDLNGVRLSIGVLVGL